VSSMIGENGVASRFKHAMRGVAATVAVITTADAQGGFHGMSATAFNSVSMDPPMAVVCVNMNASMALPLEERGAFCINILRQQDLAICEPFSRSDLKHRRFQEGTWEADARGLPYLRGCQSVVVCDTATLMRHGTHLVVIGEVVDVVPGDARDPLVYFDGRFCAVGATLP